MREVRPGRHFHEPCHLLQMQPAASVRTLQTRHVVGFGVVRAVRGASSEERAGSGGGVMWLTLYSRPPFTSGRGATAVRSTSAPSGAKPPRAPRPIARMTTKGPAASRRWGFDSRRILRGGSHPATVGFPVCRSLGRSVGQRSRCFIGETIRRCRSTCDKGRRSVGTLALRLSSRGRSGRAWRAWLRGRLRRRRWRARRALFLRGLPR